jgi:hypothetical protein
MEQNIFALLQSIAAVQALVSSRVYPVELPPDPIYPCISYRLIGGSQEETFDTAGAQQQRFEFNCYGSNYASAVAVRRALIGSGDSPALNGFGGLVADGSLLQLVTKINEMDFFDSDAREYRAMVEFYFHFSL